MTDKTEFREALEEFGRIRLSVNFLELFTTLIFVGKMNAKVVCAPFPIPPNSTTTLVITVPKNKIAISAEWRMDVDYDNALQISVYIDNRPEPLMLDYNVVRAIYSHPISFFRIGAVVPVQERVVIVIKNNTSSWVTLTLMEMYGEIDRKLFRALLEKYFSIVEAEAGR